MGIEITEDTFSDKAASDFRLKLEDNLQALEQLLNNSNFGKANDNSYMLGAELEMYIIDKNGLPLCINEKILNDAKDPQLTLELNQYNLEYNLSPFRQKDQPFKSSEQQILKQLDRLNHLAKKYDGRIIPIGILPTLKPENFGQHVMTNRKRYHALVQQLIKKRGSDFQIDINGEQPIKLAMQDVTLEGANTSFQIHYRVAPDEFANTFNAIQLVTPLLLAIAGNSASLFGHELWHETRIPLFKQSIDTRVKDRYQWHPPARVNFGNGWLRQSALELFKEAAHLYPPLLPICSDEDSLEKIKHKLIPELPELKLHQSSVWLWNRPVFDDADGGHLRIEMRALPSGPTAIDMLANAALYIGLAEAFKNNMGNLLPSMPFHLAEYNFYRAAQFGLDAKILWPEKMQTSPKERPIVDVLLSVLTKAKEGLASIGTSDEEIERYIGNIEQRIKTKQTGSSWQSKTVKHYQKTNNAKDSYSMMLEDYIKLSLSNTPISQWQ